MTSLTLKHANKIIGAALTKARKLQLSPLTVVVLDENGLLKSIQREDGCSILKKDIAIAKAWGAVNMGMSSKQLGKVAEQRPVFMDALINISDGKVMPVAGGVLILDDDNHIMGAVGISGDSSDKDEKCAIIAIKELGFMAGI